MKDLNWFKQRIGKRIYRNKTSCECHTCKDVFENGLVIADEFHSENLFDIQGELEVNYEDKK